MNGLATLHRINDAVRSEAEVTYLDPAQPAVALARVKSHDDNIIEQAMEILKSRMVEKGIEITSPRTTIQYFQLRTADKKHEVFCTMYLDTRHRLIKFEESFQGTIDGASVHPRVIATRCLELNAAAVVFGHNHPSGVAEPSQADITITVRLKKSLALLDVRVLDHIVVCGDESVSLAQRGEL